MDNSVNFLRRDPQELQLYSSLKTAQQKVPDWPGSLPVPVICLVGMQSAGQTTFIETLVESRVGTTCAGTGTRCPVRYILKDGDPYFSVGGKRIGARRDIPTAVERYMESLAMAPKESNRFSREELKVEITDHGLPLLDITDLPGLKAKGEGADEIKAVVRFYVQSQSARPVVLVKATESVETQADVELLRDVGIDPKKGNAIFVVNYFNDQLYKFSKSSELNEYCKGYVQEYGNVFFCMLIYSQEAKDMKDKLDFDGHCQYYQELPIKEKEVFDKTVSRLDKDEHLNSEEVVKRFGVVPARNRMQSIIREFIIQEGRRYADKLGPLEEQYDDKYRNVQKELKKCNPEYIKEQREKYVETWGGTVRDFQTCKKRLDVELSINPMDCALTFTEELARVHAINDGITLLGEAAETKQVSDLWVQEQLKKKKKSQQKASEAGASQSVVHELNVPVLEDLSLTAKLTADAGLLRLNDVFDYTIYTQITIQDVEVDEARAISGYAPGEMPGAFDNLQVVKEVATRPLAEVLEKLWPMLVHVEVIYAKAVDVAHETLKDHAGYTDTLQKYVTESYKKHLQSKMKDTKDYFRKVIFEKTSYMPASVRERYSVVTAKPQAGGRGGILGWMLAILGSSLCAISNMKKVRELHDTAPWICTFAGLASWAFRELLPRFASSGKVQVNISSLNSAAAGYCQRLKIELIEQFKSKIARSLYAYLKQGIISDVREDLRQHIRDVDAKRIDEETQARATELRQQAETLHQSLTHIRRVLDDIEVLNNANLDQRA